MSRAGRIIVRVAEADYEFRLGWGEIVELQETRDAGPFVIHARLVDGSWKTDDIAVTLILGLVGAGKSRVDALSVVEGWLESRLPAENAVLARAVLNAGLVGAPDEPLGKPTAADQRFA